MNRYSPITACPAWPIRICPAANACVHVHPTSFITARILSNAALASRLVHLSGSREKRKQACGVPPISVRTRACVRVTRRTPQTRCRAARRTGCVGVGIRVHTHTHSCVHALVGPTRMSHNNRLPRCTLRAETDARQTPPLVALCASLALPSPMHALQDYVLCAASTALSSIASSSSCSSSIYASRASSSSFSAVSFLSGGFDCA